MQDLDVSKNDITDIDLTGCDMLLLDDCNMTNNKLWYSKIPLLSETEIGPEPIFVKIPSTHNVTYNLHGSEDDKYIVNFGNEYIEQASIYWNNVQNSSYFPGEYYDYEVEIVEDVLMHYEIKLNGNINLDSIKCTIHYHNSEVKIHCTFIKEYYRIGLFFNPDSAIEKKYYFWFSTSNA